MPSYIRAATAICISLLIQSCVPESQRSVRDRGLVFCSEGSPESFNPQLVRSGTSFDASAHQLYDQLVQFTLGTTDIEPGLAERWEVSDDAKSYTFYLRRGVKFHSTPYFHPTRDFNADDVLFSFNRQRLSSHPYHYISGGNYPYFSDMGLSELIQDIVKVDDYTVRFELSRPESPFLATLAMEFASILSQEYADVMLANGTPQFIDYYPIGTGPFKYKRYQVDALIRYTSHPEHWRGKEKLDYLVFAITPDPSLRFARLSAGECDVLSNPLPVHLQAMRSSDNIQIQSQAGLNIGYWAFNTEKIPFNDVRVRRALNHAIDREAIMHAVYYDSGQIAKNPIPPTVWAYNEEIEPYEYSPEKARRLLEDAGVEGLSFDIWALPVQRPYNPNARKMAELMQQDLRRVGIKVRIISYEQGTFFRRVSVGEHDTVLLGWSGDNGDPDNFFTPLLSCDAAASGGNRAFWCHQTFDRLIEKARSIADREERKALYLQAQQIFKEEAPWLTIAHSTQYLVSRKYVKNLKLSPTGGTFFSGVYIDRSEE